MTNPLRLFAGVHVPPPRALVAAEHCSAAAAIWPEHPPVFTGPVALHVDDPDVGGGRGFVAAADLEPGDLLHIEAPLLAWSEEATHQPARMMQAIFDAANAPALLRAMRQSRAVQLTPGHILPIHPGREQIPGGVPRIINNHLQAPKSWVGLPREALKQSRQTGICTAQTQHHLQRRPMFWFKQQLTP